MATSNFFNKNASVIFAALMARKDEHDNYNEPDEFDVDIYFENARELLENNGFETANSCNHDALGMEKTEYVKIMGHDVTVTIQTRVNQGYYEGVNLDWEMEITMFSDVFSFDELSEDDVEEQCQYLFPEKNGLIQMNKRTWLGKINQAKVKLIGELEAVYEQISTPLGVTARFSNGETVYSKL